MLTDPAAEFRILHSDHLRATGGILRIAGRTVQLTKLEYLVAQSTLTCALPKSSVQFTRPYTFFNWDKTAIYMYQFDHGAF